LKEHLKAQKYSPEQITEVVDNITSQEGRKNNAIRFGPNRRMEGVGLPASWLETDPHIALSKYARRSAKDLAFFIHFQNKVDENGVPIARLIGIKEDQMGQALPTHFSRGAERVKIPDLSGNQYVKNVLDQITGVTYAKHPVIDAAVSLANTMILGPVSGLSDVVSVPFQAMKFMEGRGMFGLAKAGLKGWSSGMEASYRQGLSMPDKVAHLDDMLLTVERSATLLGKLRDTVYKYQGRAFLERRARAMSQAMGEFIADFHRHRLNTLPKTHPEFKRSLEFFKGVYRDPAVLSRLDDANFSYEEAGSRIAELLQGNYDFSNLPSWAIDSGVAPFFRLARWNIEQTNNFRRFIIEPARQGNLRPLIYSLFGSVVGGIIVKELREKLNRREAYFPDLQELAESKDGLLQPATLHNLLTAASYAGFAGILSDVVRSGVDAAYGNRVQSFQFPAYGMLSNLASDSINAMTAIYDGEAPIIDTALQLTLNQLKANVQSARLLNAWVLEHPDWGLSEQGKQKRELQIAGRDLRAYRIAQGMKVPRMSEVSGNPYEYPTIKQFKRTRNPQEAAKLLPEVIRQTFVRADKTPEGVKRAFTGLKQMPYNILPAGDFEKAQYYNYLTRVHGREKANQIFTSYMKQQAINDMKRKMIPTIR